MNAALAILAVAMIVALLWVRAAFVSLNNDLRSLNNDLRALISFLEDHDESA